MCECIGAEQKHLGFERANVWAICLYRTGTLLHHQFRVSPKYKHIASRIDLPYHS
jgi:hypothetical protein